MKITLIVYASIIISDIFKEGHELGYDDSTTIRVDKTDKDYEHHL